MGWKSYKIMYIPKELKCSSKARRRRLFEEVDDGLTGTFKKIIYGANDK